MIYNKPRDFSWKVLPSLGSGKAKKAEKAQNTKNPDNLIKKTSLPQAYAPSGRNVDIILDGKASFVEDLKVDENTIIDLTTMPIIDGIPILQFPEEPYKEQPKQPKIVSAPPYIESPKAREKAQKKTERKEKESAKPQRHAYKLKIASFFVLLYFGTIISFIIPLRPNYSETEKRNLKEFPTFSLSALQSGDYFDDIGVWFSDTFPFREELTKLNTKIQSFYGINDVAIHGNIDSGDDIPDTPLEEESTETESTTESTTEPVTVPQSTEPTETTPDVGTPGLSTQDLGAIIVAGDSGYEYYSFSKSLAPRFINSVSAISEKAKPTNNVFAMVIPTSIDVTLDDALRAEVNSANQEKALQYFNGSIKNAVTVDSVYSSLRSHRNEYIYFRTDHHWTALGAYYAYVEFCNTKGITPIPLSNYNTVTYTNFTGTFYTSAGQSSTLEENSDFVTTYTPFNNHTCTITKENGQEYDWDIVKDVTDYGNTLKYLTFIGGDNPLTTIINNDNPNGETCVVIKDSYGNAFVPFLVPHYSKIYVIDPRHFSTSLEDFTADKTVSDVVFISNISTTRNKIFIESMEELVR